jgi:hypothetical protein
MLKSRSRAQLLEEIDDVLRVIDKDLLAASYARNKRAVDELMESAAQGCVFHDVPSNWHDYDHSEWVESVLRSRDVGAARMCGRECWDSELRRHLDCRDANSHSATDNYWLGLLYSPCNDLMVVHASVNNVDVIDNPPDGIESGYTQSHE